MFLTAPIGINKNRIFKPLKSIFQIIFLTKWLENHESGFTKYGKLRITGRSTYKTASMWKFHMPKIIIQRVYISTVYFEKKYKLMREI